MRKNLYIFHNKAIQKCKFEKNHVMLITVDNVDFVIYKSQNSKTIKFISFNIF